MKRWRRVGDVEPWNAATVLNERIEIQIRPLANDVFSGEYHSGSHRRGMEFHRLNEEVLP